MSAFVIDTSEFSRFEQRREGGVAVADLARLSEELADTSGMVRWAVRGGAHSSGQPQLTLSVSVTVKLMCQRCLLPFALDLASESVLILAKNEAAADEIDAILDDEAVDVIVGARELNILDLIEDELLLAVPLSPKHAVCPDRVEQGIGPESDGKATSPFAVLKNKPGQQYN